MSEKTQQVYPLAPSSYAPRSDQESNNFQSNELKKKKRMKCLAYIAIFAVLQIAVITVFALTVMKVKSPKVRFGTVTVYRGVSGNIRLNAEVAVKNTNFGHYKYYSTTATVTSGGVTVGQFIITNRRVRARSTKRVDISVDLDTATNGTNSGVLELKTEAKLRGKVQLMKVIKKEKSADMSCTMSVNLSTNSVQNLVCK